MKVFHIFARRVEPALAKSQTSIIRRSDFLILHYEKVLNHFLLVEPSLGSTYFF